ncbi:19804_t:CDS:2, partial [Racocetra fulgida]
HEKLNSSRPEKLLEKEALQQKVSELRMNTCAVERPTAMKPAEGTFQEIGVEMDEPYEWYRKDAEGDKSAGQFDPVIRRSAKMGEKQKKPPLDEYVVKIKIQKSSPNKNKIGIGLVKTTKNQLITVNPAARDPSYLLLWSVIRMFDPGET